MAGIYVYSDKADLASELISFAKTAGKPVVLLTLDEAAADDLSDSGADKIYLIKGSSDIVENYAQAIAGLLENEAAGLLAVGATPRGRDLAARIAGYLDCGMASDVLSVDYSEGILRTERMMYGGAVVQCEELAGFGVVTIPPGLFEPTSGAAVVETIELVADDRVRLVETAPIEKQGSNLAAAEKVVCVGMAFDREEDMQIAKDLAAAIGADMGCTRGVAEDRHWMPGDRYIGISGAAIKPKLYLSLGVSGQIQHVYGIRESRIIAAIDSNEKAPIFKAADYGILGDMYEVVPALIAALKN